MTARPLQGRVVMITGAALAGSNALIDALAARGASLALCASAEVRSRAKRAQTLGVDAATFAVAWHSEPSVKDLAQAAVLRFGRVDAIVHIDPPHVFVSPKDDRVAGFVREAGGLQDGMVIYYVAAPAPVAPASSAAVVLVGVPAPRGSAGLQRAAMAAAGACVSRFAGRGGAASGLSTIDAGGPPALQSAVPATPDLRAYIRDVPDFPQPGILFRDVTPLLKDPPAFAQALDWFTAQVAALRPEVIVAIESRGFLFGAPVAVRLGLPLVPVRKPGKLPSKRMSIEYSLEYGESRLDIHADALASGQRAVIVDDLLATGGTAEAASRLVELAGGAVAGLVFLIELAGLRGRSRLTGPVESLVRYD